MRTDGREQGQNVKAGEECMNTEYNQRVLGLSLFIIILEPFHLCFYSPLTCTILSTPRARTSYFRILYRTPGVNIAPDIFARYNGDQTALHLACKSGASTIACDFLDRGCSIETTDLQGLNALHYAVRANRYDTVRMILDRDEQLAQHLCRDVDARGRTLMHHRLDSQAALLKLLLFCCFMARG